MSKKNSKLKENSWFILFREGSFIVVLAMSLFFMLALLSYHQTDFLESSWQFSNHVHNAGGRLGALFASVFLKAFGLLAFVFPLLVIYSAWLTFYVDHPEASSFRIVLIRNIGIIMTLLSGCALLSLFFSTDLLPATPGGVLGLALSNCFLVLLGFPGAAILLTACLLAAITFFSGVSWLNVSKHLLKLSAFIKDYFSVEAKRFFATLRLLSDTQAVKEKHAREEKQEPTLSVKLKENMRKITEKTVAPKIQLPKSTTSKKMLSKIKAIDNTAAALPSIELLESPKLSLQVGFSPETLEIMSQEVEQRLHDFGVTAKVVSVHPGPVITRFELDLAPGVKVSKISGLAKDLARSLSVISVRIVEVIPGKSVIGLELPNENRQMVCLSEVLVSEEYQYAKAALPLVLGKDISGVPVVVDLAKMPHLLVAGTTGSGKSVGLNAMLLSLLFKHVPEDLRLIMIDPKMLELAIYDDIPHLLTPVVTDMKESANALRWCVAEMERRYRLLAACGVRNLAGFNRKVKEAYDQGEPILDPLQSDPILQQALQPLPYIVIIIDEFADMMMVVGKKVEQLIARIAQKARAAGIHMILATQRPSVDVITGLIKSNIPTRIAFQVSSKIDSRTIIDQQGAEQLLGHGDMLYLSPGSGAPSRVHGAFVADQEVHAVTTAWKQRGKPDYLESITDGASSESADLTLGSLDDGDQSEQDALYDEVVYFVTQSRKVSVSSVQRRFKIGYNRAARLVETMEAAGVVSAMQSNGSREVLAPAPVQDE